jgi:hypothetical protein
MGNWEVNLFFEETFNPATAGQRIKHSPVSNLIRPGLQASHFFILVSWFLSLGS